ncbi:phosphatase PAP2 family protein [Faecalibacterium prausnitzii]|uniref:phosphatase PAP2 family protein n=1 Tax=Faecalibacterium prausnitzii TaxID=853 RepID=UPI003F1AA33C
MPSTATPPCPRWASDPFASCARSGLCRRNGRFRFPHCNIAFQYNRRNLFLHSCFLPAGLWWAGRCVTIDPTDRRFFMPFEFAFLDWLQQFHNPVLDALAVFLNYAGEHGEIWIAFTLLLLLFRRTRKAGCAMATALVLYLVAGDCILKPLFARPRPCDVNTAITILVKRPHGHSFPSGHTASAFAAAFALWLQNRKLGVPALVLAAFIAFTRLYLYVHFPTDVLGGLVLGLALGALASWIVDSLANKPKKKQSV